MQTLLPLLAVPVPEAHPTPEPAPERVAGPNPAELAWESLNRDGSWSAGSFEMRRSGHGYTAVNGRVYREGLNECGARRWLALQVEGVSR